jgi:hypothetical protein
MIPAIAVAMLVIGGALALVLDKLWLDAARAELQTAGEAAALAAATRLADDERLMDSVDPSRLSQGALLAAQKAAESNTVAGSPLQLTGPIEDYVRCGELMVDPATGAQTFRQTDVLPTSVQVQVFKLRTLGNPVARLFGGWVGESGGDAIALAEASLDDHVVGLRPFEGGNVPALPMALLANDPSGERDDTWAVQIEQRQGADSYSFNAGTRAVELGPDGLPEMVLHVRQPGESADKANVQLIDLGTRFVDDDILRQVRDGWRIGDLADFGGELPTTNVGVILDSSVVVPDASIVALAGLIGQKRIIGLYENSNVTDAGRGRLNLVSIVAVRVLSVDATGSQIIVQPTVLATRTAVIDGPFGAASPTAPVNPYIFKIALTR